MKLTTMTEGRPSLLILKFALPLMLGGIFQELYTIADTIIVGQFLGVDALAAVGASGWITWMLLAAVQGFTQGFGVLCAQLFGAGDISEIKNQMSNSLILSIIISLLAVLLGQIFLSPLLRLLNTPERIFSDALIYLKLYYSGCPITMAYNYAASHLRAFGNSSAPLKATVIASIINIVLDILFIGPFGWGIVGAIVATLIAQLAAAIYSFYALFKIDFVKLSKNALKLETKKTLRQLALGLPMSVQYIIIAIGGIIVQFVVNRYSIEYIAGVTATNRLYALIETAAICYGFSITTYVGQNVGSKNYSRIVTGMKSGNLIALITSLFIMVVMFIFGRDILSLFISGSPKQISDTLSVAWRYLVIMVACLPLLYLLHIFKASVIGFGSSFFVMLSGIAELIFRVSASFVLPALYGKMNLFYAEPLAWLGALVVVILGYAVCYRQSKQNSIV